MALSGKKLKSVNSPYGWIYDSVSSEGIVKMIGSVGAELLHGDLGSLRTDGEFRPSAPVVLQIETPH